MAKVTNNYTSSLRLGDTEVPAKGSAEVPNWASLRNNGVISRWLESGILSISDGDAEPEVVEQVEITEEQPVVEAEEEVEEQEVEEVDEDAEKERLIADLAELGVKADKRSSLDKLREKWAEAQS